MIKNITTGEIISQEEIVCKTIRSQARGLMFRRKKQNLIMTFPKERKISLHMFFVFYPIDVIFLDKDKNVIEVKENFKPFTFWNSKNKGKYLIELSKEHSKISIKEELKF